MKNIDRKIFWGVIISFLVCLVGTRHAAIPIIFTELVVIPTFIAGLFRDGPLELLKAMYPIFFIILGQLIFLILGIKKTLTNRLLIPFISSPFIIISGVLIMTINTTEDNKIITYYSLIPFIIMTILLIFHILIKKKAHN